MIMLILLHKSWRLVIIGVIDKMRIYGGVVYDTAFVHKAYIERVNAWGWTWFYIAVLYKQRAFSFCASYACDSVAFNVYGDVRVGYDGVARCFATAYGRAALCLEQQVKGGVFDIYPWRSAAVKRR